MNLTPALKSKLRQYPWRRQAILDEAQATARLRGIREAGPTAEEYRARLVGEELAMYMAIGGNGNAMQRAKVTEAMNLEAIPTGARRVGLLGSAA